MIYLLKFGASFVLPPGIFIVLLALLVIACWRRQQHRIAGLLAAVTVVFYLLSTGFTAEYFMGRLESVWEPPQHPQGDVIIMLGGGAIQDTPDVDGTGSLCSSPSGRLLTALRLHRELGVPILVSGGQVYADSGAEAKIARRVLMSLGVPEQEILVETESVNTRQNAEFSAKIMAAHGLTRPILVTSAFHMERAMLNFQKEGVAAEAFPTDYMVPRHPHFHYNKLMPQASALAMNATFLQEKLRSFVTQYFEK